MPLARWLEASPTNATSPPSSDHPPPNSTSPPPRIPSAPRLPPQPTPPPPKPSDPSPSPPSNSSTPATPSSPPPKIPVTPTLPPRPLPSPPYSPPPSPPVTPTLPSRPLPSPPYSPPPSVPVTPSVPPPSNSTTPIMPLPPGTPGGSPPLIPTVPSPPAPRGRSPTVIPSPPSSENTPSDSDRSKIWISKGAIAGISIGAAAILVLLCLLFYNRKKKRSHHHCQDNSHDVKPQHWQHNDASQGEVQPRPPAPPPPYASPHLPYPPPPLPPHVQFSSASGGNNSGSEPLTPNFAPPTPNFTPSYANSSFTYEELSVATNGFSEFNLLGQGGFGYVHKGVLPNGKEVAIKQLKAGSGQGEREFQAEVEIISRVHHRHLVSLVGYCISGYHRLLVYEYVPNKTLEFHLHAKNVPPMDWPTRLKIALASAKGLAYLHEDCRPKIIHRDIKAANILLELNFDAKVADFGLAKPNTENNTHVSTRVMGTFGYLAPEYASSGKLTEKSDVFSFGVMLLEIITGKRPVDSIQFYGYDSLVDWARPLLSKAMKDDDYVDLIDPKLGDNYNKDEIARMVACAASCVRHSARRRPMMSKIVRALEGDVSLNDLNDGIRPGQCSLYGSTDYDKMQYEEDMRKFRNLALSSTDEASSEYTVPTASGSESGKRQETQS